MTTQPKPTYDLSHGSSNPYTRTADRHGLPPCPHCRATPESITFDGGEQFAYFNRGAFVQDAFPTLSAEERDMISVGVHPECSDAFYDFPGEE